MISNQNFKKLSFLVYGLGLTGKSVVNFFKRNNISRFQVWDDTNRDLYKNKRPPNLGKALKRVNYIILSPGVTLNDQKLKKRLLRYKKKIITDLDLFFLLNKSTKTVVVTGTNGKSTTCKIIAHLLNKNKFKTVVGGNIGTPVLNLKIKKNFFLVIEASSFQLAHSQHINPDYAFLLNISNDHIDWHGSVNNYINSKFKIFNLQNKKQFSLTNKKLSSVFKRRNLLGKLIVPNILNYKKIKSKIKNPYLNLDLNDENMSFVFEFSKLLAISAKSFIKSFNNFKGLHHRYEIFLKKKNCIFINDSKATSFQSSKFALQNTKNIFWILGGLPKKNDKIILGNLKKNIIKSYIIGKNVKFFKRQLHNKINYFVANDLEKSITQALKDIKYLKKSNNVILLSPASASFDQFKNFEKRGEKFKQLSKFYARKYI